MRWMRRVLALVMVGGLGGCQWMSSWWPERKPEVPITPPLTMAPPTAVAQAPEPVPESATPPLTVPRPATVPVAVVERPTPLTELTRPGTGVPDKVAPATSPATTEPDTISIRFAPTPASAPAAESAPGGADTGKVLSETKLVAASVIQVNERFITVEDVLRGARGKLVELPRNITEQTFREQARKLIAGEIRRQVTESLVYAEAQKRLADEQKKEVDKEVNEALRDMLAAAGGSRKKVEQDLAKEDTTLDLVMQEHRRQSTNTLYLRSRFMPSVVINRKMLLEHYQRNLAQFTTQKKVQMQLLSVPYKAFLAEGVGVPTPAEMDAAQASAKEQVDKAVAALKSGEDFSKVVKDFSRGQAPSEDGVWPPMPAGSFRQAKVEEVAFAQPAGQVSDVVQTDTGYYVVKTLKVELGKTIGFEDAQDQIGNRLRDEQYHKITQDYFMKLFSEGATIVETDKFGQLALERALERYWRK